MMKYETPNMDVMLFEGTSVITESKLENTGDDIVEGGETEW